MSDTEIREDEVDCKPDPVLEEEASRSLWSKCKWYLALVVPAGILAGLMMVLTAPEKAAEIPIWFIFVFCVVLMSGVGCVFLIPSTALLALGRGLMTQIQPDRGWGRKAASAATFTIAQLLWLGAILTPIVFRADITLLNFALATLVGAGICLAMVITEMVIGISAFLVVSTVSKRLAKRSRKR